MRTQQDTSGSNGNSPSTTGSGTVHRTVRVMAAIANEPSDVSVGELADRLSLPVPTTHRLLGLLREEGIVHWNRETHRYSAGTEFLRIAAQLSNAVSPVSLARAGIEELRDAIGETVLLGAYLPNSHRMSFEARAEGPHPLQYRIDMHKPVSLVWGASGKSILAFLPEGDINAAMAQEDTLSADGKPLPDRETLFAELKRVRNRGFAVTESEKLPGARGIAAPVFSKTGIFGSICVTSPQDRTPIDQVLDLGGAVKACAEQLSYQLGYQP